MIKNFEYKGLWFLPSNANKKIPGILKYDYENNKNTLELIGSFYEYSNYEGEDIILGITTDGDDITLSDCSFKSSTGIPRNKPNKTSKNEENEFSTLNFRIRTVLKGHHFLKKEDLVFQQIYLEIFNLDEWIGISGFETDNDYKNNTKNINYQTPEPIKVNVNDDIDLEIKFLSNHPIKFRFTKELKLSQKTIFSLQSKKYKTLNEFIYLVQKFKYFLSTSLQKPSRIENIELYSDKITENIGSQEMLQKAINGYQIINPELKFEQKQHPWEMLFTFNDIKSDFELIMKNWFSNYEHFEAPFNLVLNQYYVSKYYLENLFINVAQAAESFHRRLDLVDDTPKKEQDLEFENKVNRVIDSSPTELKAWVKSRISKPKHFYDARLKYILKEFSNNELDKMIGSHKIFVKDVVMSRNYYTHYNKAQKKDAADGIELVRLYQKLKLLLISAFLIESGFDKSKLESLIKEKSYNLFGHLLE
ncbi:HEPN domain-containing protein [Mariniflexile gromovii]|uniref:ApeA N-terminal domain-containing protein n=1 Tax=Mariniflexile gromovii TaxID=362523 RepID=A0ABS4BZ45_9FLAO|nr:HEPN domain-containing protein [Mariniflexile gromovii]MBP0905857.1 hypothetical protein [Mariniflexile gromovii]